MPALRREQKFRTLGEVFSFRNEIVHPKDKPSGQCTFVGLEHVESNTGYRTGSQSVLLEELGGRRARFKRGDIVYGYLRPYLNKVWVAEFDGICSVDQYVLQVGSSVDRSYLSYYLRSAEFLQAAPVGDSPGQLPRIRSGELAQTPIPLPPLDEQRRIAAILDQADALRRKRRESLNLLTALEEAAFIDAVNRHEIERSDWPVVSLEKVSLLITDGEHQTPVRNSSGHKLLSARNVQMGRLDFQDVDFVGDEEFERISKRCASRRDDVLISCSGTIGRVSVVNFDEPMCLVRSVALVRADKSLVEPLFLEGYLRTPAMQQLMRRAANASGQPNLFQGPIRKLPILLPPIELQRHVATTRRAIQASRATAEGHLGRLEALFASLQHRAFNGELTAKSAERELAEFG